METWAEMTRLKTCCTIEAMRANPNVDSLIRQHEANLEQAEAQSKRLRAALEEIRDRVEDGAGYCNCDHSDEKCCVRVGYSCHQCIAATALAPAQPEEARGGAMDKADVTAHEWLDEHADTVQAGAPAFAALAALLRSTWQRGVEAGAVRRGEAMREAREVRAALLDACHAHALDMESWVRATAEMFARELAGYREREAQLAAAQFRATRAEAEVDHCNQLLRDAEVLFQEEKDDCLKAEAEVGRLAGGPTLIKSLARAEVDLADAQAEIAQVRLEADHDWALWCVKWEKSLDTCASHSEMAIKAEAALAAEREQKHVREIERDAFRRDAKREQERSERLRTALEKLVHKIEVIEASAAFGSVFTIASVHGAPYRGETWTPELTAARAALAPARPEEPEVVGLLKRWQVHAGEGFQDVISLRYLINETSAFLACAAAIPAQPEEKP